jgi:hypothetical protein
VHSTKIRIPMVLSRFKIKLNYFTLNATFDARRKKSVVLIYISKPQKLLFLITNSWALNFAA